MVSEKGPQMIKRIINEPIDFVKQIIKNRYLILELTKRDFCTKYIENIFGLLWAIIDPLVFILILWFVFTALRAGQHMEVPFITYLILGLVANNMFSGILGQATNGIKSYSFLIKEVNFRIAILPIVKVLSELILHFIMILISVIILMINGIFPTLYFFQLIYYIIAASLMLTGITWGTASIKFFFPDISKIIEIINRFMLFFTPIFWDINSFPEKYRFILKLNPLFYIVQGYRESLLFNKGFWESPLLSAYFWLLTFFFLFSGAFVFKKLRPHFADVI